MSLIISRGWLAVLCSDEPDAAGGGAEQEEKGPFTKEYVRKLREQAMTERQKAGEAEQRVKSVAETMEREAAEKIAAVQKSADERLVKMALWAEALRAGIVDADALKLADVSGIAVLEDGSVAGVSDVLAALKKAKPYLFAGGNGSTPVAAPIPKAPEVKKATEMSAEEYRMARAVVVGR